MTKWFSFNFKEIWWKTDYDEKVVQFCCSAFILSVLTMMPIRSTTEIIELVMIVTPMTNLIKIDDDWWRWQYRWLSWLASISTLAPERLLYCPDISLLRWSSATQFFSNQTKTNNTNKCSYSHLSVPNPVQCSGLWDALAHLFCFDVDCLDFTFWNAFLFAARPFKEPVDKLEMSLLFCLISSTLILSPLSLSVCSHHFHFLFALS